MSEASGFITRNVTKGFKKDLIFLLSKMSGGLDMGRKK